jgi:hypothetical protein
MTATYPRHPTHSYDLYLVMVMDDDGLYHTTRYHVLVHYLYFLHVLVHAMLSQVDIVGTNDGARRDSLDDLIGDVR